MKLGHDAAAECFLSVLGDAGSQPMVVNGERRKREGGAGEVRFVDLRRVAALLKPCESASAFRKASIIKSEKRDARIDTKAWGKAGSGRSV